MEASQLTPQIVQESLDGDEALLYALLAQTTEPHLAQLQIDAAEIPHQARKVTRTANRGVSRDRAKLKDVLANALAGADAEHTEDRIQLQQRILPVDANDLIFPQTTCVPIGRPAPEGCVWTCEDRGAGPQWFLTCQTPEPAPAPVPPPSTLPCGTNLGFRVPAHAPPGTPPLPYGGPGKAWLYSPVMYDPLYAVIRERTDWDVWTSALSVYVDGQAPPSGMGLVPVGPADCLVCSDIYFPVHAGKWLMAMAVPAGFDLPGNPPPLMAVDSWLGPFPLEHFVIGGGGLTSPPNTAWQVTCYVATAITPPPPPPPIIIPPPIAPPPTVCPPCPTAVDTGCYITIRSTGEWEFRCPVGAELDPYLPSIRQFRDSWLPEETEDVAVEFSDEDEPAVDTEFVMERW